jgi:peptide deformylase
MVTYVDACFENKDQEYKIRSGVGLAGPQVGLMYRVIYIHGMFDNQEHRYLLANPKIISESKMNSFLKTGEGCLSVEKEITGIVKRKNKITVIAYDMLQKKERKIIIDGHLAICFQHEIDHLDGILYYDRINKFDPFYKQKDWIAY